VASRVCAGGSGRIAVRFVEDAEQRTGEVVGEHDSRRVGGHLDGTGLGVGGDGHFLIAGDEHVEIVLFAVGMSAAHAKERACVVVEPVMHAGAICEERRNTSVDLISHDVLQLAG